MCEQGHIRCEHIPNRCDIYWCDIYWPIGVGRVTIGVNMGPTGVNRVPMGVNRVVTGVNRFLTGVNWVLTGGTYGHERLAGVNRDYPHNTQTHRDKDTDNGTRRGLVTHIPVLHCSLVQGQRRVTVGHGGITIFCLHHSMFIFEFAIRSFDFAIRSFDFHYSKLRIPLFEASISLFEASISLFEASISLFEDCISQMKWVCRFLYGYHQ